MTTTLNNSANENTPKQQHRSKRIELIIIPGRSLGPFRLGKFMQEEKRREGMLISTYRFFIMGYFTFSS